MLCSLFQKRFRLLCLEEMVLQILETMKCQFDGTIFPTRIIILIVLPERIKPVLDYEGQN